jgi:hypothetical protein
MESLICPLCKKELGDNGLAAPGPGEGTGSMLIEMLYCGSCEMLVAPLANSAPRLRVNASDNRGRIRCSGSNAGGSQRGMTNASRRATHSERAGDSRTIESSRMRWPV